MNRYHRRVFSGICIGLVGWGLTLAQDLAPFDIRKSQQELEIMRGILSTTLRFVAEELDSESGRQKDIAFALSGGRFSNIEAFYLYGQGAVFTIPAHGVGHPLYGGSMPVALEIDADSIHEQVQEAMREAEETMNEMRFKIAPFPAPPAQPVPQAPPAANQGSSTQEKSAARQQKLRQRLADVQEKVRKRQEESERRQANFLQHLAQVKVHLIEALANHGDSMTVVKPTEYINLVITARGHDMAWRGEASSRFHKEVLSVRKSAITDYKAGRLTLEDFKTRVLQYQN